MRDVIELAVWAVFGMLAGLGLLVMGTLGVLFGWLIMDLFRDLPSIARILILLVTVGGAAAGVWGYLERVPR